MLAAASLLLSGCGGISASRTVSPLDFFLPGIIKADGPAPATPQNPAVPAAKIASSLKFNVCVSHLH